MAVKRLKVTLAVHRPADLQRGVPPRRVRLLADAIRGLGHRVQLVTDALPASHDGDLLHVFAGRAPDYALDMLRLAASERCPTVVSPEYHDLFTEKLAKAVPHAFEDAAAPETIRARLSAQLASHATMSGSQADQIEHDALGILGKLRDICSLADHLILTSRQERDSLAAVGIARRHHSVIPIGIDPARDDVVTGALFQHTHGLRGHILSIGPLKPRMNQLLLVHACRALGRPIALIGEGRQSSYGETVRRQAPGDTVFLGRIDDGGMVASAVAGAAVLVQPSWADGAPGTALEAAAIGIPLVLSCRSAEREYFGTGAEYCDPGDPDSIATAVRRAISSDSPGLRTLRRQLVRDNYALPIVAAQMLGAYERTMQAYERRLA